MDSTTPKRGLLQELLTPAPLPVEVVVPVAPRCCKTGCFKPATRQVRIDAVNEHGTVLGTFAFPSFVTCDAHVPKSYADTGLDPAAFSHLYPESNHFEIRAVEL